MVTSGIDSNISEETLSTLESLFMDGHGPEIIALLGKEEPTVAEWAKGFSRFYLQNSLMEVEALSPEVSSQLLIILSGCILIGMSLQRIGLEESYLNLLALQGGGKHDPDVKQRYLLHRLKKLQKEGREKKEQAVKVKVEKQTKDGEELVVPNRTK